MPSPVASEVIRRRWQDPNEREKMLRSQRVRGQGGRRLIRWIRNPDGSLKRVDVSESAD